jgi:hypothetical protein
MRGPSSTKPLRGSLRPHLHSSASQSAPRVPPQAPPCPRLPRRSKQQPSKLPGWRGRHGSCSEGEEAPAKTCAARGPPEPLNRAQASVARGEQGGLDGLATGLRSELDFVVRLLSVPVLHRRLEKERSTLCLRKQSCWKPPCRGRRSDRATAPRLRGKHRRSCCWGVWLLCGCLSHGEASTNLQFYVLGCCFQFGDFVLKFRNEYVADAITSEYVASLY